jgi:hypothetical protein
MDQSNLAERLRSQATAVVRRLLSEQDRDRYSLTYGCFDRRYWAWKLVDFPDATFQRNVYPLAMIYGDPKSEFYRSATLYSSISAGLDYAAKIQHPDGSFDQAFPHEHSFGATAFILHSLLETVRIIREHVDASFGSPLERCLQRATEFLGAHNEEHGFITNHLAGAVLSLLLSADHFAQARYRQWAEGLLGRILQNQSPEGWFPEYEGADPGYQTLCVYYLAQVYRLKPSEELRQALGRAIEFISYFIHPDGTFGGEYGSRRTAVFYPGGFALLSGEFPLAVSISQAMGSSINAGHTATLRDMDMGNLAPLLSNYVCASQCDAFNAEQGAPSLPWEQRSVQKDFLQAGLSIRGTAHYYAILGVANGGVLKVFGKRQQRLVWDDGGYIGQLTNRLLITTQMTVLNRTRMVGENEVVFVSDFYKVLHSVPTPSQFVVLRLLNLTFMRVLWVGNLMKRWLVKLLISRKRRYPVQLRRRVQFSAETIIVEDHVSKSPNLRFAWLECGRKFVAIHMASAKYFEGRQLSESLPVSRLDVDRFNRQHCLDVRFVIEGFHA